MSTRQASQKLKQPVTPDDHIRGDESAVVTLVEYGDYECPVCGRAHFVVEDLRGRLGSKVRFVYRHFPLRQTHLHAQQAAEAAEAAGAQSKFWEMHDTLFTHQDALELRDLMNYSIWIGLDPAPFRDALNEHRFEERVRGGIRLGARSGVNGTPTFFINDSRYDGPREVAPMLAHLEAVISEGRG